LKKKTDDDGKDLRETGGWILCMSKRK